ncbi:amidohydrolase [Flavobacteriaceae bacterium]|jgi:omega-amidase|nr:amidohydrolase [Flavobacteriaceae bacterium]
MQDRLKIAIIQSDLIWEEPAKNRSNFTKKINQLKGIKDIIVLPEMFTSGFTMQPERVYESMNGNTITWMKHIAEVHKVAICGSLVIKENSNFFNRFVFVTSSGHVEYYDKRHTFSLAGEHKSYTSGNNRVIINYKGWKIMPQICYDLRFPVWSRNIFEYDLLIYVANWPTPRIDAWDALLKARAIENMSYCIGVNRTGFDNNKHKYPGHSAIYNGLGDQIAQDISNTEYTDIVVLEKPHLEGIRQKFKFLNDQDDFILK